MLFYLEQRIIFKAKCVLLEQSMNKYSSLPLFQSCGYSLVVHSQLLIDKWLTQNCTLYNMYLKLYVGESNREMVESASGLSWVVLPAVELCA